MTDRDLKPGNVRRTPEDVREKTDATAADFAAWHERTKRGDGP